ncbi:uncharacterized protein LOC110703742 isoform X1 [Chenopodium quinoa]|uniref:uncharacterized protein LOC110703742 isoform X1 n=2 Tax=Chenopodium quinoa TaxID=63459 RepID=UPI000B78BF46|nr:uncharacterized protein LOC110703742 isoform X1 [Chenopodium quinoa]
MLAKLKLTTDKHTRQHPLPPDHRPGAQTQVRSRHRPPNVQTSSDYTMYILQRRVDDYTLHLHLTDQQEPRILTLAILCIIILKMESSQSKRSAAFSEEMSQPLSEKDMEELQSTLPPDKKLKAGRESNGTEKVRGYGRKFERVTRNGERGAT